MVDRRTLQRAPGAVEARVDDRLVLLSPIDFSYHAVDPVGSRIWDLLREPNTVDQVVESLMAQYEVDDARCRADVEPFLERMVLIGVVEIQTD